MHGNTAAAWAWARIKAQVRTWGFPLRLICCIDGVDMHFCIGACDCVSFAVKMGIEVDAHDNGGARVFVFVGVKVAVDISESGLCLRLVVEVRQGRRRLCERRFEWWREKGRCQSRRAESSEAGRFHNSAPWPPRASATSYHLYGTVFIIAIDVGYDRHAYCA